MTWNSSFFHFAAVVGPAIGGFIVARSVTAAYVCDFSLGVWYVLCLLLIRTQQHQVSKQPVSLKSVIGGAALRVSAAHHSRDDHAGSLCGAARGRGVPACPVAKDILHVDALGIWHAADRAGGGRICMGLTLAHMPPMQRAGVAMLWAVAGFGVATIVFGLSRNFYLSLSPCS